MEITYFIFIYICRIFTENSFKGEQVASIIINAI